MNPLSRTVAGRFLRNHPAISRTIRSVVQPRNFQLYCVGAPKTGTHSIAAIFERNFRTSHEPTWNENVFMIKQRMNGQVQDSHVRRWLRLRDWKLWLECESSHPTAWFVDCIVQEFPFSKFILTIRDCYSWCNSIIDQHLNFPGSLPGQGGRLRDAYFHIPGYSSSLSSSCQVDNLLEEHGLFTLEGYISYWACHNEFVLDNVPSYRLMVVPTHRILDFSCEISEFLGMDKGDLVMDRGHSYKASKKHDILGGFDREYIGSRVKSLCGGIMSRLRKFDLVDGYDLVGV